MIVVDSSIALQWVLPEPDAEAALALLGRADLTAPDILLIEAANVLAKNVRAGGLTAEEAQTGLQIIRDAVQPMPSATQFISETLRLSVEIGHPAYDCCFLACAIAQDASLATRDEPFMKRAKGAGYGSRLHIFEEQT